MILFEPRILKSLFSTITLLWVHIKHFLDHFFSFIGYTGKLFKLERESALSNFFHNFLVIITIKRWESTKENVEDDTARPNVTLFIITTTKDLRGYIIRCTKASFQLIFGVKDSRSTKINQFNHGSFAWIFQHDILGFQIPMNNVILVAVIYCTKDLMHNVGGFSFGEKLLFSDSVKQFTSCKHFSDNVEILLILKSLYNLHDVYMI
mmetsp:Transcript_22413/g.19338  ORF Transcript_22413/g.19338 Transcript_22413/m.19338 type:complete len:207 (-) Transcript_22413:392-1012(-)